MPQFRLSVMDGHTIASQEFGVMVNTPAFTEHVVTTSAQLETALAGPAWILPGDLITIRGGTYRKPGYSSNAPRVDLPFNVGLLGAPAQRIAIRNAPGETVIIDGQLSPKTGGYLRFIGTGLHFRITNTGTANDRQQVNGAHLNWGGGANIYGKAPDSAGPIEFINIVIYNVAHPGVGLWTAPGEKLFYGVLSYGIGSKALNYHNYTNGQFIGSSYYMQNESGRVTVKHSAMSAAAILHLKSYTQDGYASGFHFIENVMMDPGLACIESNSGPAHPMEDIVWDGNHCFTQKGQHGNRLGYHDNFDEFQGTVVRNRFAGGNNQTALLGIKRVRDLTLRENVFYPYAPVNTFGAPKTPILIAMRPASGMDWDIGANQYWVQQSTPNPFIEYPTGTAAGSISRTFAQWQAQGFDVGSQWLTGTPPTEVLTYPNEYEVGRGMIVVWNYPQVASVQADVSDFGLTIGQAFTVVDAFNPLGAPVVSGTYTGSPIALPMNLTALPGLGGGTHNINHLQSAGHPCPIFGSFVLLPG